MLILRKTISFNLILIVILLLCTSDVQAETVEYDGLIEPWEVMDVGAPTEGIVAEIAVDRSDSIKKGQILVELEASVEQAALEKARAMAAFESEIALQKTQLAFARRVHERVRELGAISPQDKDQAETEIALTEHRLQKAQEKKELAGLELKKAKALLARRSVKSPISGVVVERYVSPGEYVSSQPLIRVAQIDPLRVEVIVPAPMFGRIIPGMTATIVPELVTYEKQTASVTIVDRVIDSASNTFGVRLELPNSEQKVPAGLKCLVRFEIDGNAVGLNKPTADIVPD